MTNDQRIRELAFLAASNPVGSTDSDFWKQALDRLDPETFENLCKEYSEEVWLKDTASNVVTLTVREFRTPKAPDQTTVTENRMAAQIPIADEAAPGRPLRGLLADAEDQETAADMLLNVLCLDDGTELELFARADGDGVFARALGVVATPGDVEKRLDVTIDDRTLVFEQVADEAGIYRLRDMSVGQYDAFMTRVEGK